MYNVNENENDNENENEGTNKFDAFWSAYPRKTDKAKAKIEQMTNISKQLKAICKRQKVFGVVISSLSRATEGRADHRPLISDQGKPGSWNLMPTRLPSCTDPTNTTKTLRLNLWKS